MAKLHLLLLTAIMTAAAKAAPFAGEDAVDIRPKALETEANTHDKLTEITEQVADIQRRAVDYSDLCNSSRSESTYPAANIIGRSGAWLKTDTDGNRITAWNCNYGGAFVDGGMIFNLTDKKLYVPVCGYYYISSQVQFASYQRNKTDYAQHQLIVEPKCADQRPTITTNAYSYGTNETEWVTATHTGRVFKLCNGGSVYIRVPQKKGNACCPRGKHDTTFISAHLVREMSCP